MGKISNIDLSKPRRRYYSDECKAGICPECGSAMIKENCTIILAAKSDTDEGEFATNITGSCFCNNCPVVVFNLDKLDQAAKLGIKGSSNLKYIVAGIIDLDSIPENKRHLELGSDENPVPLVHFLPDLNFPEVSLDKKPGRNDPCSCGSGKKYKKCCGKM